MSRIIETISLASGDTSSNWVRLNTNVETTEDALSRTFSGSLTSGDTITVDVTNDTDPNTTLETYHSSDTYSTDNFGGVFEGGWQWIRVRKTGSAGAATVKVTI